MLTDAASLSEMVGTTCALADDVSTKVRELDTVKVRLQQTLQRAKDISGLRVSGRHHHGSPAVLPPCPQLPWFFRCAQPLRPASPSLWAPRRGAESAWARNT